jgi:hypothetical protein
MEFAVVMPAQRAQSYKTCRPARIACRLVPSLGSCRAGEPPPLDSCGVAAQPFVLELREWLSLRKTLKSLRSVKLLRYRPPLY